jgi:hypothetical protein
MGNAPKNKGWMEEDFMSKHNGEEYPEVNYLGEWIGYGDVKLVHAACKAWLARRGIKSEEWNRRPFLYRKKKSLDKRKYPALG